MIIGVLQVEIFIPHAQSIKDKRSVLKSVKDKIHNAYNVSVSEIAHMDTWQRSMIAVVTVSNEQKHASQVLDRVHTFLDGVGDMQVVDQYREFL